MSGTYWFHDSVKVTIFLSREKIETEKTQEHLSTYQLTVVKAAHHHGERPQEQGPVVWAPPTQTRKSIHTAFSEENCFPSRYPVSYSPLSPPPASGSPPMTGLSGCRESQTLSGSHVGLAAEQWKNQPQTQAPLTLPF